MSNPKQKAHERLKELLAESDSATYAWSESGKATEWMHNVRAALRHMLGEECQQLRAFNSVHYSPLMITAGTPESVFHRAFAGAIKNAQTIIRSAITEYEDYDVSPPTSGSAKAILKLFVSHSSKDSGIVRLLVDLLKSTLRLAAEDIRCTSVDGYRLRGGADTSETLRREVHDAQTFLGVVSQASLESMYVAFELGARWGAKKHLLPVLAPGADASILSGPLSGINALRCDSSAQIHQLIRDLASELGVEAEPASVYQRQIDEILKTAQSPAAKVASDGRGRPDERSVSELVTVVEAQQQKIQELEDRISGKGPIILPTK